MVKSVMCIVYMSLALVATATTVHALPMLETDSDDNITGVSGLNVDSIIYDAIFNGGSFDTLYASDPTALYDFPFAEAANDALYSFMVSINGIDITNLDAIVGCDRPDLNRCSLATVHFLADIPVPPVTAFVSEGVFLSPLSPFPVVKGSLEASTHRDLDDVAFVVWNQSGAVPEPPIVLIMVSGLIVIGVTRRMRRA